MTNIDQQCNTHTHTHIHTHRQKKLNVSVVAAAKEASARYLSTHEVLYFLQHSVCPELHPSCFSRTKLSSHVGSVAAFLVSVRYTSPQMRFFASTTTYGSGFGLLNGALVRSGSAQARWIFRVAYELMLLRCLLRYILCIHVSYIYTHMNHICKQVCRFHSMAMIVMCTVYLYLQ